MAEARRSPKGKTKKASPKTKKTAELYKSSHNIGNRQARFRVGSYKDSEYALVYPEGFWEAVKIHHEEDDDDFSPVRSPRSKSPGERTSRTKHSTPVKGDGSGPRTQRSPSSGRHKDANSLKELKVVLEKKDEGDKKKEHDKKGSCKKEKDKDRSPSPCKRSSSHGKEKDHKTSHGKDFDSKSSSNHKDKGRKSVGSAKKPLRRPSSASKPIIPQRAARIKRTACLNAAAIVGLLYENEEPSPKRQKVEVGKEQDPYDVFSYNTSDDDDDEITFKTKPSEILKKKKLNDEKNAELKKKLTKKYKEKSGKGVKKTAPKKKVTKKCQSSEEESDSSSSEDSDDEVKFKRKAEDDIPLWPPPKRMASLNAQVGILIINVIFPINCLNIKHY